MFIQECVPAFDLKFLRAILGEDYAIEARIICPTQLGLGMNRKRQWSIGALRECIRMDHPFDGQLFGKIFHRVAGLTAEDYFVAPVEERLRALQDVAARRRNQAGLNQALLTAASHSSSSDASTLSLKEVLSPGSVCRLEGYQRLANRSPKFKSEPVLAANIAQNPDCRPWLGSTIKTLLRNSDVVLLRSSRLRCGESCGNGANPMLMTADEHLNCMGWPMYDTDCINLMKDCAPSLDPEFKRQLAGNAQHVAVAGAVLLWALAATCIHDSVE